MNRGIARRTVFEDRDCVRYFLSRLARVARGGDLEVHSFVCLTTHFHLLVRSPRGQLSESMRKIQNQFVRWFNRRSRRDGPLFRGRFLSKPVHGLDHRSTLVRYIDQNPVRAGLVELPEEYPFGSAHLYHQETGPRWMERSWIESDVRETLGLGEFTWSGYRRLFGAELTEYDLELVQARLRHPSRACPELEDLVRAAPDSVYQWMLRKARLADGTPPSMPIAPAGLVLEVCSRASAIRPDWRLRRGRNDVDAWSVIRVALLRDLCGQSWVEIARRCSVGSTSTRRHYRCHQDWIVANGDYTRALGCAAGECLQGTRRRILS